jgi:hypothetical protein
VRQSEARDAISAGGGTLVDVLLANVFRDGTLRPAPSSRPYAPQP